MIEKHAGRQHLVCDCGFAQRRSYAADEFDVMIADAKAEGWAVHKVAGEWTHTCPACKESARRPAQRSLL
jgi:hypothetical protein